MCGSSRVLWGGFAGSRAVYFWVSLFIWLWSGFSWAVGWGFWFFFTSVFLRLLEFLYSMAVGVRE